MIRALLAVVLTIATAATAKAASISPTILVEGIAVNETVKVEDDTGLLNDANWFIFSAMTGDTVIVDIERLAAPPNLLAHLYFGDVTGQDFGRRNADNFSRNAEPELDFILSADSTQPNGFGGPGGDPLIKFTAQDSGIFSVVVTSLNIEGVGSPFQVVATGIDNVAPVPLPSGGLMLISTLAGLGAARKRKLV